MIDQLISFSIKNKLIIGLFILGLIGWGGYSAYRIPIDAVPDITTNQVLVITQSPTLATQEVEQFVTFPVEMAMANLPDVTEIRSISRFGLSVVTVVFEDWVDIYLARQLISEQLKIAEKDIPPDFGTPELGPISTGLGEVYQYVIHAEEGYDSLYSDMDLRSINDWIVIRQLAGTKGVIEVSGWGGHLKQYEVSINPDMLRSMHLTVSDVYSALENNNENTGGSYIEKRYNSWFIRGDGLARSLEDIGKIVVKNVNGTPILVRDVADVGFGSAPRYGAITWNSKGEVVGGQVLMLKGENSYEVVEAVRKRVERIQESLPEGLIIEPYIDRSKLIGRAISTVTTNLIEGGLIVIFILVLLLGNFRGGLIVASVIPLSMLFAMGMMNLFGVSANLMSLGAIDFGLIVDGSVIIVEAIIHRLQSKFAGQKLDGNKMNQEVEVAASKIRSSAAFGEIIILIVYLPILALVGIEGKMFMPMAQTVSFAIIGALILSMTYVPMMASAFLRRNIKVKKTISDRIIGFLQKLYDPTIAFALKHRILVLVAAVVMFGLSLFTFSRMGGEFIPTLDEGDFALHQILPPGSSLRQSVEVSQKIQRLLLNNFPEVEMVVSKIGSAEIPTDPMPIEVGDIMVRMAPREEWVSAKNKEEMFEKMEKVLSDIPGVEYEFTQPIQMRFNELIAGVREDVAIKIFGEDPDVLFAKANEISQIISQVEGIGDLRVEQTQGLPQMMITYDRQQIARYGLQISDINQLIRMAFAGEKAGVIFEGERRFDLVLRFKPKYRQDIEHIKGLFVTLPDGSLIPLEEVAQVEMKEGPAQISRENARRRIVVGVNARNRDTESMVTEIQEKLEAQLDLPPGYYIEYGGQFENLIAARQRLLVAVPVALLLILVLLFITFNSFKQAILIFTAIPLSAIGGIYALWLRDMPFSISAGVGFIALFGVAVLNGIVLIAYFNRLKSEGMTDIRERILTGTRVRMRPVIMTGAVAAFGFLPMAISTSAGAEVQRPLATVVIGGLFTATFLTLIVLPVLYSWVEGWKINSQKSMMMILVLIGFGGVGMNANAQSVSMDEAVSVALKNHPAIQASNLRLEKEKGLKKTAFEMDKMDFGLNAGQINYSGFDYQFNVSQGFKFPTAYSKQAKVNEEKVNLRQVETLVTASALEREVRLAWMEAAWRQENIRILKEQADTYKRFSEVAKKRFEAGETGILEKTASETRQDRILLKMGQAQTDLEIALSRLAAWMNSDEAVSLKGNTSGRLPLSDSLKGSRNPMTDWHQRNVQLADKQISAQKSSYLPDLKIGYINQQIEGTSNLNGFQVGLNVPVLFWGQKAKVDAARMDQEIALKEFEEWKLSIRSQLESQEQEVLKLAREVDWYENQGLSRANLLAETAEKAWRAGEADYIQFIQGIDQSIEIRNGYVEAMYKLNSAVIELQYIMGSFN